MKKYDGYALITGGSSGIGLAFAKKLASLGYDLVIVSNVQEDLNSTKELLEKEYNVKVITLFQDLADSDSTDKIFEALKGIHVGLLINNAGLAAVGPFHTVDRKKCLDLIRVLTLSVTDLTYKFLPAMLEKSLGAVIFVSSISSQILSPFLSVYGSCKAFSLKLGVSLHAEYALKGIDILTICPGWTDTKIYGNEMPPPKNMMTPDEVVEEALGALGKKIVLNIYGTQTDMKIAVLITQFLSYKRAEKIIMKKLKDLTG